MLSFTIVKTIAQLRNYYTYVVGQPKDRYLIGASVSYLCISALKHAFMTAKGTTDVHANLPFHDTITNLCRVNVTMLDNQKFAVVARPPQKQMYELPFCEKKRAKI